MAACLEEAVEPHPARFGGLEALAAEADHIASSPLMPEFLRMLLSLLAEPRHSKAAADLICHYVEGATDDFVWTEVVDLLDAAVLLPSTVKDRCFARFLAISGDRSLPSLARTAGLDGALRWAIDDRRKQLRLTLMLLDVQADDDAAFLARAAKVTGVAYSHWREQELLESLLQLSMTDGASDEAAFELGMAKIADGLDAESSAVAATAFAEARNWFEQAAAIREQRPDARLYVYCLETLISFSEGTYADQLGALAESLAEQAFQLHAWHESPDAPPWLGARHAEAASWEMLALKLRGLAEHLNSAAWWEPAAVIEQHLLTAYCAGRAILKRDRSGAVETMIRPRIEGSLVKERYQAQLLKTWLFHNAEGAWRVEAEDLTAKIDALMSEESRARPAEAATGRPTVAALLNKAQISQVVKDVIADAISVHSANMTAAEQTIIETCISAAWECSDYRHNTPGKKLFNAVLMWTMRFLASRLDLTKGNAPLIGYLFAQTDGSLPHEKTLQTDYFNLMLSTCIGSEIEVSNVGGGRADVRFSYAPERLVVEIKREGKDASFENLGRLYSAQTTDYQNISIRLGFLLVLDQTKRPNLGTPHISTLVKPTKVQRDGEPEARLVIIVNVPGRRCSPSELTKLASKAG